MKAKRLISALLLVLAFCSVASAQKRLDILLRSKDVTSISVDDIDYMEVVEGAAPGELDGYWFLGWRVPYNGSSGTPTHVYGTEILCFTAGPRMKWIKSTTESVYNLTYPEEGAVPGAKFTGTRDGSSTKYTWQILVMEGDLMILLQGTTRYYFYKTKEAAIQATELVEYPTRAIYTDGTKLWNANIKGGNTHSDKTPMGIHFENYAAATDEDKAWLADPNNQPDLEWHGLSGTLTARTITLYPFSSPVPADVNQTGIGDCCMCAVFASFAYIYPEWIKTIIEPNKTTNPTQFTVHMFDPMGNPVDVVVDNKMLDYQVKGKNGKYCWSTVMEKALMKWETRFKCHKIGGIGTEVAAPPFTGNGNSYSFGWWSEPKLFNSEYPMLVNYAVDNGMIGVGGFHEKDIPMGDLNTVTAHAFTVMKADEGADYLFVMRNPWGSEPSGSTSSNRTDGKLKIPNDYEKLRLLDFRLVYPGAQMAQYKKENLGGYTPPRFRATYKDMNPSEEMLRMYGVQNYSLFPIPEGAKLDDYVEEE